MSDEIALALYRGLWIGTIVAYVVIIVWFIFTGTDVPRRIRNYFRR
jgi:hypothetical protein